MGSLENCVNSYYALDGIKTICKEEMTDKARKVWLGHTECQT